VHTYKSEDGCWESLAKVKEKYSQISRLGGGRLEELDAVAVAGGAIDGALEEFRLTILDENGKGLPEDDRIEAYEGHVGGLVVGTGELVERHDRVRQPVRTDVCVRPLRPSRRRLPVYQHIRLATAHIRFGRPARIVFRRTCFAKSKNKSWVSLWSVQPGWTQPAWTMISKTDKMASEFKRLEIDAL